MDDHLPEETLSALRDGELSPHERRRVEAHLAECPRCRRVLRGYELLAEALRGETVPVPASLPADLRARLHGERRSSTAGLRFALGGVATGLLLVAAAVLAWPPTTPVPVASAYPAPETSSVAVDTTIEIVYTANVDRRAVEAAVAIEPPVPVTKAWRGDTLVLRPERPLTPNTRYSVRAPAVAPPAANIPLAPPPSASTPAVVTNFRTAPVAVAAAPSPSPVAPTPEATVAQPAAPAPAPPESATPTPTAEMAIAMLPTSAATPAPVVVRGFGLLYRDNAPVREALGRPTTSERAVQLAQQSFAGGQMLWRDDERTIYVLLADGGWLSLPDTYQPGDEGEATPATALEPRRGFGKAWREMKDLRKALGAPAKPEVGLSGAVQTFASGTMVWTEARAIYVLYASGRWEEHRDTYVDPSATPTPTATPRVRVPTPRAATPLPTPALVGTPTPTPATACTIKPTRGFGLLYEAFQTLRARLGCATAGEVVIPAAEQTFEGGLMLWDGERQVVRVLVYGGGHAAFPDTYQTDEPLSVESPPAGLLAPLHGFGKVWRDRPDVRQALGWATAAERGFSGASQRFERGTLFWSDRRLIIAVYDDGRWEMFPDEYPG
jgi:hypothetical protein